MALTPALNMTGLNSLLYIPVAIAFDEEKPGFRVHGNCGTDHKHTSKPK